MLVITTPEPPWKGGKKTNNLFKIQPVHFLRIDPQGDNGKETSYGQIGTGSFYHN
jgi:hypothetical protein